MQDSSNAVNIPFPQVLNRLSSVGKYPAVLTDIFQEEVNITIWQNRPTEEILKSINNIMQKEGRIRVVTDVAPDEVVEHLIQRYDELGQEKAFCHHIALLVDMFCTLFELKRVGLRLTTLDQAMCPKFHVDKVPCRLITTFSGAATQWLPHETVDRSLLGAGSLGIVDELSGLIKDPLHVQNLAAGDVALLKGESWFDNENGGLVHRSPALPIGEKRLILTLDFSE